MAEAAQNILTMVQPMLEKVFSSPVQLGMDLNEFLPEQQFFVLSGKNGHPRWIIPSNPKWGCETLCQWRPYGLLSSLKWAAFLRSYQLKLGQYIPGVMHIGVHGKTNDWQHLGYHYSARLIPVIYVGTPSAIGKLVPTMVDIDQGHPQGVSKIPFGSAAGENILHEIEMLRYLETIESIASPVALFSDLKTQVSTQSYIKASTVSSKLTSMHIDYLKKLRLDAMLNAEEMLNTLKTRLWNVIPDEQQKIDAIRCVDKLIEKNGNLQFSSVIVHGDFSPWNVRILPSGELILLDWEDGKISGMPFYDLLHYHLIQVYVKQQSPHILPVLLENPLIRDYLQHFQLSNPIVQMLYLYYFLDFWCRHWEQGDAHYAKMFYNYAHTVWDNA